MCKDNAEPGQKPKEGRIVFVNRSSDTAEDCLARLRSDFYSPEKKEVAGELRRFDTNDIEFTVLREGRKIIGFSLVDVSAWSYEAQNFCLTLEKTIRLGRVKIIFEGATIIFEHGGVSPEEASLEFASSDGGVFKTNIEGDLDELRPLLSLEGVCDWEFKYKLTGQMGIQVRFKKQ